MDQLRFPQTTPCSEEAGPKEAPWVSGHPCLTPLDGVNAWAWGQKSLRPGHPSDLSLSSARRWGLDLLAVPGTCWAGSTGRGNSQGGQPVGGMFQSPLPSPQRYLSQFLISSGLPRAQGPSQDPVFRGIQAHPLLQPPTWWGVVWGYRVSMREASSLSQFGLCCPGEGPVSLGKRTRKGTPKLLS
jgi:hypothetical protein